MIVLDTNVVSELMRPEPADRVRVWADTKAAVAVTAVTVAELLYGLARLPHGARRAQLEQAARWLVDEEFAGRVLPFDRAAAEHYADLAADRDRRGRPLGIADAQIAAICRSRGAGLATRNTRDFEETGIGLVDPWTVEPGQ
jgi:predicted nucleic acid-binding protein